VTKIDKRLQSLEDQIRERSKPTVANLVRDVNERPGYHTVYWHKAVIAYLRTRNPEVFEWRAVQKAALKEGLLRRDVIGKLWPATGPFPKPFEYTNLFLREWARPAIAFVLFVVCFSVTAYGGAELIERFGWIGHVWRAIGLGVTLVTAGIFWRAMDER
jgi:hypothetical protein